MAEREAHPTPEAPAETPAPREKVTLSTLFAMKARGEKIAWLTAYDYPTARLQDEAGIDMILVGDSASMTVYGNANTMPITMDTLIGHTQAVVRGAPHAFVVGDMPFLSYQVSPEEAVRNAGRFMKEAGTDAIKLEGGVRVADKVRAIVNAGIPVIGHIGLTPQSTAMLGGFKVQGQTAESARLLIEDAMALQQAGVSGILLECIPTRVSEYICKKVDVLVFSIGGGPVCDGQLLIVHDMLGIFETFQPKFVKRYANLADEMRSAFRAYAGDVRSGAFPEPQHEYKIKRAELEKIDEIVRKLG